MFTGNHSAVGKNSRLTMDDISSRNSSAAVDVERFLGRTACKQCSMTWTRPPKAPPPVPQPRASGYQCADGALAAARRAELASTG